MTKWKREKLNGSVLINKFNRKTGERYSGPLENGRLSGHGKILG